MVAGVARLSSTKNVSDDQAALYRKCHGQYGQRDGCAADGHRDADSDCSNREKRGGHIRDPGLQPFMEDVL